MFLTVLDKVEWTPQTIELERSKNGSKIAWLQIGGPMFVVVQSRH